MKKTIVSSILFTMAFAGIFSSCKYDDFLADYDFSAVYFGSQQPLRTVVVRHDQDYMQIKVGAVLSGLRVNKLNHWVTFEIAEDLLPPAFTLLPPAYYTMEVEDNRIVIPEGKFLGDFPLKIDKRLFTADPLATGNHYALPLRMLRTSADSILMGNDNSAAKNYTIIVIKYIAPESGTYYVKGFQDQLDGSGEVIPATRQTYSVNDLSRNKTRDVATVTLTELNVAGVGALTGDNANRFKIGLVNGMVTLSRMGTAGVEVTDLGSAYNDATKIFTLKYEYVKGGVSYRVEEEMILRQDPELDLRFEEWQ